MSTRRISFVLFSLAVLIQTRAQLPPDHAIVLAEAPGTPRSTLELVDPANGAISSFGRFPSDVLAPRALAWDPIGDELILALVEGTGTRIVALRCRGTTVLAERVLHRLQGEVTDLEVDRGGRVFVAIGGVGGGLLELGRRTTDRRSIASWPHVSALDVPSPGFGVGVQSAPLGDPRLAFVDLLTGVFQSGPHVVPGLTGVTITGAVDLPTGAIRQVLSDDQGRLHLFEFLSATTTLPIQPALPPGGTRRLLTEGGSVWILGGASSPFLRELTLFQWTTLGTLAGPLANDPVDFARTDPLGADVQVFGEGCGSANFFWRDQPSLGSTQFAIGLSSGVPNAPALLVLGSSEGTWLGTELPIELLPGCRLWVAGEVLLPAGPTTGTGGTEVALPVPNHPQFVNARVYAQWFQSLPPGIVNSPGLSVRIGP